MQSLEDRDHCGTIGMSRQNALHYRRDLTKFVLIMKLTFIFLFAFCLGVHANGYTQTITLSEKNTPLEQVLLKIKKQTGYHLVYRDEWMKTAKTVTVDLRNATITAALDLCFKDQPLTYTIIENTIVIKQKEKSPNASGVIPGPDPESLSLIDITGKITDPDNNPLAGATVKVKGTAKGTTTDNNGVFSLKGLNEDAVLEISYVGYQAISVPVNKRSSIVLSLKRSESKIDEVQIIAYGQTSKRFQTGNVFSVKAEDIAKQPVTNVLQALEGRVPGLQIQQATGFAGSGIKVRIQGENSIDNGNDPLYIVDGVPYTSQLMPSINTIFGSSGGRLVGIGYATYGSPLNYINPSDIESVEVLKDADATAIYGSQAANGAVLITTKKGKAGDQRIEFNLQQGWGKVTRKMDLLNTRQYVDMRHEALKNDGIPLSSLDQNNNYDLTVWDTTRYTDWQKLLIGNTAHYTDLQGSVSGGNTNTYYSIGAGYHKETTVIPGDFNDQKASMHFQITSTSSNQKFRVSLTGNYMNDQNKLPSGVGRLDLTNVAVQMAPDAPALYNPDGTLNWALNYAGKSTWGYLGNPVAQLQNKALNKTNNVIGNCILNYQLVQGLNIKSSFGYTRLESNETITYPLSAIAPEQRLTTTNSGNYGNNIQSSWAIEPQLTYQKKVFKGNLDAIIGSTFQEKNNSAVDLAGFGYISDEVLDDIRAASSVQPIWNFKFIYKYTAVFARVNYNWQNRYILNLTGRRDGSSRFGENNQFHNFGSAGAAWIFSEEKFARNLLSFFSFGKIKVSYGTTGSDQISDYRYLSTYSPITSGNPYQGINTLRSNGLANPYLHWEETRKLSTGLDLGFFKDRVMLNATYYRNRSSNQLLAYSLAITTGFGEITQNFPATVQNTGVELVVSTINVKSEKFRWSTNFNITHSQNELVSFPGIESTSYGSYLIVGEPTSIVKKLHYIGVDQSTGLYYFNSKTDPFNPKTPDDANVIINTLPEFYGGLENSFIYKGLDLSLFLQFNKQTGPNFFLGSNPGAVNRNQPTYILDRWQKPGDVATHQQYSDARLSNSFNYATNSDGNFGDASYIRLKNVSLSYQLSEEWIRKMHIRGLKFYAHAQNLLTFTKYKGLDPETMSSVSLPPLRVLTVGAQITL